MGITGFNDTEVRCAVGSPCLYKADTNVMMAGSGALCIGLARGGTAAQTETASRNIGIRVRRGFALLG